MFCFSFSKDAIWNIVQLNDLVYTFSSMFETIVFDVHVAETSENVTRIEFYSQFCGKGMFLFIPIYVGINVVPIEATSHPSAIYVHNILKKKLSRNFIKSVLGEPYSVLSLLDLVTVTGDQLLDILCEFDELEYRYGVVLDNQLK